MDGCLLVYVIAKSIHEMWCVKEAIKQYKYPPDGTAAHHAYFSTAAALPCKYYIFSGFFKLICARKV